MRSLDSPHELGRWGEECAARTFDEKGWRIMARNYRFGRREIDLIVYREGLVAFVEVKTRSGVGYGAPEEALTSLKRREIELVASQFLVRHGLEDVDVRFDVFAIVVGRGGSVDRIEHTPDAWRPGWH